jgi:hypothetical protein
MELSASGDLIPNIHTFPPGIDPLYSPSNQMKRAPSIASQVKTMDKFNKNNSSRMELTILASSLRHHESNRHSPRPELLTFKQTAKFIMDTLNTCHDAPPCIPPLCNAMARTRMLTPHERAYLTVNKLYPIAQHIWPNENIRHITSNIIKHLHESNAFTDGMTLPGPYISLQPDGNVTTNGNPLTQQYCVT